MTLTKTQKTINMNRGICCLTTTTLLLCSCIGGGGGNQYSNKFGEVSDSITSGINNDTTLVSNDFKYIDIPCNSTPQSANGFIQDLELVALETNGMSLVEEVDKLIVKDSLVYLLDRHQTRSLKVFDLATGRFIQTIGTLGRSNAEYIDPTDFVVTDDRVIILDNTKKLLFYDLNNNFIHAIHLKYALESLNLTENEATLIGVAGDNGHLDAIYQYKILEIHFDGTIQSKYVKNGYDLNYTQLNNLKVLGTDIWYHSSFSNELICIENSRAKVQYKLRFDQKMLPEDFLKECHNDFSNFREQYQNQYSYLSGDCGHTKRYFFSNYANQGALGGLLIYDKEAQRVVYNGVPSYDSRDGELEDYVLMRLGTPPLFVSGEDCIYGILPARFLAGFRDDERVRTMLSNQTITETDNPILFKMRLMED